VFEPKADNTDNLISELSPNFFSAIVSLSHKYNINPIDLLSVMAFESGIKPAALNKSSRAVGLIQFMPKTLKGMGYKGDWSSFQKLSAEEQIPYIDRYFAPYAKYNLNSPGRVYQAVFLPDSLNYAHNPDDIVAGANGPHAEAYAANKGFDVKNKGFITVEDLTNATSRAKKSLGRRWDHIERNTQIAQSTLPSSDNNSFLSRIDNLLSKFLLALAEQQYQDHFYKKSAFEKNLIPHNILIQINSDNIENSVEFARILCIALDEELCSNAHTHANNTDVEVECIIYGSRELSIQSILHLCDNLSKKFEFATRKNGGYQINTIICLNKKSNYQELDIKLAQSYYNKFHLKFLDG
jgi:Transglycosylase SLT domain